MTHVGHINHSLFWKNLAPASSEGKGNGGTLKAGPLKDAIDQTFGSLDALKKEFNATTEHEFWGSTVHTVLSLAFSSLDTMTLHVAVNGTHADVELKRRGEVYEITWEEVRRLCADLRGRLPQLESADVDVDEADLSTKHWEDLTSVNSQADIARLRCNINIDEEIRHDFVKRAPKDIVDNIHNYLDDYAQDVFVTHAVFSKVLPAFLQRCSPRLLFRVLDGLI